MVSGYEVTHVPPEVFSIIVMFVGAGDTILSLLCTSKDIYLYICMVYPVSCNKVLFKYPVMLKDKRYGSMTNHRFNFVHRLSCGNFVNYKKLSLKVFPRLTYLELRIPTYKSSISLFRKISSSFLDFFSQQSKSQPENLLHLKLSTSFKICDCDDMDSTFGTETIMGKLFKCIKRFRKLKVFDISGFFVQLRNRSGILEGINVKNIGRREKKWEFTNLRSLKICHCVIPGSTFNDMSKIQRLALCRVVDYNPFSLQKLSPDNLVSLKLRGIVFRESFEEVFGHTRKEIEENWRRTFRNLKVFEILETIWTGQEKIPFDVMKSLTKLVIGGLHYHSYRDEFDVGILEKDEIEFSFHYWSPKLPKLRHIKISSFHVDKLNWINGIVKGSKELRSVSIENCFNFRSEDLEQKKKFEM